MRFMQNAFEAKAFQATCKRLFLLVLVAGCLPVTTHAFDIPYHINKTRFFQDSSILRGKITSAEDGIVLPQVSVQNLVSGRGTFSNSQGEFAIGARRGDSIRISYAGKSPQTITFRGEKFIEIHMTEGGKALSEVIVTGFQTIEKKKFAGSAATVKMDDAKLNGQTDISRMLEGRAAGVSVQNVSGTFGAAPKVRVRGATSINGDNKPLWVVDGVVLEDIVNISNDQLSSGDPTTLLGSAVAGLNANDIESFDILKDASAAALYGARAMNGVVVITTKKGRQGKPSINYIGNFSTYLKPSYSNFNIMNSAQQMSVLAELERKGSLNPNILDRADNGVYGKMYDLINTPNADNSGFMLANTQPAKKDFLTRYAQANTDWFDLLFRNNFMQEHSLSVSGGTDRSQSYFSTSYYGDNGWTTADKVSRYTLNFRNNYKFSDKVSADFTTVGSVREQKAPGALSRQSNPVEGSYDRDFDINPFSYALNTSRTLTAFDQNGNREYFRRNFAPFNILTELENNYMDLRVIDLRLQGSLNYKITPDLRYEFVGALRYVKSSREHQITESSNMANAYRAAGTSTIKQNNKFLYKDPEDPNAEPVVVLPYGGFYNRVEDQLINYDFRNSLNYTKTFNDIHSVSLLVGQQVKYADRQNFNSTGYGYQYENGGVPFIDYRILKQTIENNFPYYGMSKDYDRFVAFYGSGTYTYNSRYNLTGTVRYDGSNRLGKSTTARWLPTWSVAGSWNMEQEKFMENVTWVDAVTVRGSYGLTASMGPATNSQIVLKNLITNRTYLNERESVIQLANLENSELTWEKLYTANAGIDATLLNRRLNFSVDVYHRNSFDLISLVKTSGVGGEPYKAANYADLESQGIELLVGYVIVNNKNFKWRTNLTAGYNTNKITNAKNEPNIFDLVQAEGGNKEGYPVRSLFSLNFKGLEPFTGTPQFTDETGKTANNVYLQDQNTSYLVYEGPVDPRLTGGLLNSFSYKDFTLSVFITYQAGNKIRLYPAFKNSYTDLDAMPKEFYDRWSMPGDEKYTTVPSILGAFEQSQLQGATPYNNYNYSTARVASGDMVRLKNISLGWQVPQRIIRRMGLSSLNLQAVSNNPWLIYSDKKLNGQDPEFFNTGGIAQPIQKQFTFSLKLGI
ncbi:SusC/RagA family protein [Niastella yeongjuensis]|uniref:SusC/RagA family protein n=1 Tax=Niastella yeongjuensis TaxID=354355 RepID=A0A1V9F0S6_9BACT|nr:SusC/RagA family TonB-linked outer membrane protein [Niastella yeongjuensis]OQP51854.1 SusC/RagA family protein [Niastella yeongjuensis]SEP44237.1 TonB-linked outer membrane protein, SusC/RagA family [Niastella yeongjuensis]